jgi:hypothetical protein
MRKEPTQHKIDKQGKQEVESENASFIAGFELEYKILIDESNLDSPIDIWFNNFDLCNEKLENIEVHSSATVNNTCFEANSTSYVKCDNYIGGEFTTNQSYVLDQLNTEKFYRSLDPSFDLIRISEIIQQKFGGLSGLTKLEEYCKEKEIEYQYTDLFRE